MLSPEKVEEICTQAFLCEPSLLDITCMVYPITVGEIVRMGLTEYNKRLGILLLTKDELIKLLEEKGEVKVESDDIDVLSYLLKSADNNDIFLLELQTAFSTFLKEEVLLLPTLGSVVVGAPEEKRLITSENFEDF